LFYLGGSATTSAVFAGSNTSAAVTARDETFINAFWTQAPTCQGGTFPCYNIQCLNLNTSNGAAPAVCQSDPRQFSWRQNNTVQQGGWLAYTPIVSAGSGAFGTNPPTAAGRYQINGNVCTFSAAVTFQSANSIGTAGTYIGVSLPISVGAGAQGALVSGRELTTGAALLGVMGAAGTVAQIYEYNGTSFYGANSYVLLITGSYEIQPFGT
jgi:hypothetical protein